MKHVPKRVLALLVIGLLSNSGCVHRPGLEQANRLQGEKTSEGAQRAVPPPPPVEQRTKQLCARIMFNNVMFGFDKAALTPEGKAEIGKAISELKKYPKDLMELCGHTCDIGAPEYNMALGQRRADAIRKYMVDNGIDASRIKTSSKGMTAPGVPNSSPRNRELNRRVEFNCVVVN